jgi:hypothetical protein
VQTKVLHLELSSGGVARGSPATYELEKLQSIVCVSKGTCAPSKTKCKRRKQQVARSSSRASSCSRIKAKSRTILFVFHFALRTCSRKHTGGARRRNERERYDLIREVSMRKERIFSTLCCADFCSPLTFAHIVLYLLETALFVWRAIRQGTLTSALVL